MVTWAARDVQDASAQVEGDDLVRPASEAEVLLNCVKLPADHGRGRPASELAVTCDMVIVAVRAARRIPVRRSRGRLGA
jgi:hypothetical protein